MNKLLTKMKWNTRQRLAYIETKAYYTGSVSRSDVSKAFALSDPAATKALKLYNDLAPDNLRYKQSEFAFIISQSFKQVFADLQAAHALPLITSNHPCAWLAANGQSLFGINTQTLPYPTRLPKQEVVANVTRAIHQGKQLEICYASINSNGGKQNRTIEPHSIINTGTRWHVRAYNVNHFDFRDFVLSRMIDARLTDKAAESSIEYDEDWTENLLLSLMPHPKLDPDQQLKLLLDYSEDGTNIELTAQRALLGYTLHALRVDTTSDQSMNPHAFQLVLLNREEVETYAAWALM